VAPNTVNSPLTQVTEDLSVLRELARVGGGPDRDSQYPSQAIAIYLAANRRLIDCAVEAWANTPERELRELQGKTLELDASATRHSFVAIATSSLFKAHETLVNPLPALFQITDDNVHMLDRVVRFANHIIDTQEMSVAWHPVRELLGLPELPVDQAREQALAIAPSHLWRTDTPTEA
jgi:hypothetical protein